MCPPIPLKRFEGPESTDKMSDAETSADRGKRKRGEPGHEEHAETSEGGENRDFEIEGLPEDILLIIVRQLEGTDLARLSATCKTWREVVDVENLWRIATRKNQAWKDAIATTRQSRPKLTWKEIFVNLYCVEKGICKNCFKRSRSAHVCGEELEEVLKNSVYNAMEPLCTFFPGLHHHNAMRESQTVAPARKIEIEVAPS